MRTLFLIAVATLALSSSALAGDVDLPTGWRLPSKAELADSWRTGSTRNALAVGDFNGDGKSDGAYLVANDKGDETALVAFVTTASQGKEWFVLDRGPLGDTIFMGLDSESPGEYMVLGPNGYDDPKTPFVVKYDCFTYYRPESAASIFVWSEEGKFEQYWLSD